MRGVTSPQNILILPWSNGQLTDEGGVSMRMNIVCTSVMQVARRKEDHCGSVGLAMLLY